VRSLPPNTVHQGETKRKQGLFVVLHIQPVFIWAP